MVRGYDRGQGMVFTITDGEVEQVHVNPIFYKATGRVDPDHVLVHADDPRDWGRERRLDVKTDVFHSRDDAESALEMRLRARVALFGTFSSGMLLREGLDGEQINRLQTLNANAVLILALQLYAATLPDADSAAMQILGIGGLSLRDVERFVARVTNDSDARVRKDLADDGRRPDFDPDEPDELDDEESE
jgi:hypothetical protein